MSTWYLITHSLKATQLVTHKIRALGAELFSPTKLKVTKRADCNGVRTTETQLFPGYLFVKLDPGVVHPSVILQILGVNEFVRFGGEYATVPDSLIDAIKKSLLLKVDQKVAQIEYRNVSPEILKRLESIAMMKCTIERQSAFFALLQSERQITSSPSSRVVSVIERPFVNDRIS